MDWMISITGEPEQLAFLPEIAELGSGIELGSYGLVGVRSEQDWQTRFAQHQAIRVQFQGRLAIHGPFIGMEFAHIDHLIRASVQRRVDMTFDVAVALKASRVVLHAGFTRELALFQLQNAWLDGCSEFWQREIRRWADAGIEIVLENDTETSPDLIVQLVNTVDSPLLGLCLDIGHQHLYSELNAREWVRRMDQRLLHIHLHDNDRTGDKHWPIGRGTIDFDTFLAAVMQHVPHATITLETIDSMKVKMDDLRKLITRFAWS